MLDEDLGSKRPPNRREYIRGVNIRNLSVRSESSDQTSTRASSEVGRRETQDQYGRRQSPTERRPPPSHAHVLPGEQGWERAGVPANLNQERPLLGYQFHSWRHGKLKGTRRWTRPRTSGRQSLTSDPWEGHFTPLRHHCLSWTFRV